jgi:hypothetical protein
MNADEEMKRRTDLMDHETPHRSASQRDRERYYDDSDDLVARIRRAKEAFQREVDAFGDPSEYEIQMIYGQRSDINYDDPPALPDEAPNPESKSGTNDAAQSQVTDAAHDGKAASLSFDFEVHDTPKTPSDEEED